MLVFVLYPFCDINVVVDDDDDDHDGADEVFWYIPLMTAQATLSRCS